MHSKKYTSHDSNFILEKYIKRTFNVESGKEKTKITYENHIFFLLFGAKCRRRCKKNVRSEKLPQFYWEILSKMTQKRWKERRRKNNLSNDRIVIHLFHRLVCWFNFNFPLDGCLFSALNKNGKKFDDIDVYQGWIYRTKFRRDRLRAPKMSDRNKNKKIEQRTMKIAKEKWNESHFPPNLESGSPKPLPPPMYT